MVCICGIENPIAISDSQNENEEEEVDCDDDFGDEDVNWKETASLNSQR